jgi:Flp pilus assembly pilin Flp
LVYSSESTKEAVMKEMRSAAVARRLLTGGDGQALVEYAFILLLIVIVLIAVVKGVGNSTCNMYSRANSAITSASNH